MTDRVEDVTNLLADDLRRGAFAPGTWLKQVDLQQRYGVGRATIRKVLETLAVRRLVRYELHRGYSVHPLDSDETRHILELRAVIEAGFAPRIVALATPDEIATLQALADDFLSFAQSERVGMLYQVNLEFHRTLLRCARNPLLMTQIDELRIQTSPAPVSQWASPDSVKLSADQHLEMVAAIRARQAETLARVITAHVLKT